jgi:hypothetical protein
MVASPNVLRMFFNFDPLAKRAPNDARADADEDAWFPGGRNWAVPSLSGTTAGGQIRLAGHQGPAAAETDVVRRSPAHTQVLGFQLFAPKGDLKDATNLSTQSHIPSRVCRDQITFRSRPDVAIVFAGRTPLLRRRGNRASACRREADHHEFVSRHTPLQLPLQWSPSDVSKQPMTCADAIAEWQFAASRPRNKDSPMDLITLQHTLVGCASRLEQLDATDQVCVAAGTD